MNQKVFITGASSGIGEYVAYEYAKNGATIGLSARRKELLDEVANKCKEFGGNPIVYTVDVGDQASTKNAIDNFLKKAKGIDIIIANAGISGKVDLESGHSDEINRMLSTNILGVSNSVLPVIPTMVKQKSGKVVVVSSIAGFRALPSRSSYSASKIAIRFMNNSWRYSLNKYGIRFITICPGFIKTELTDKNKFKMPLIMDADKFAKKMIWAIDKNKKTYIAPWQWRFIVPIIKIVPDWLINFVVSKKA